MAFKGWRVCVEPANYGRTAEVFVTRKWFSRFSHSGILVATLNLSAEDAETQLAEAKHKANAMLVELSWIEDL